MKKIQKNIITVLTAIVALVTVLFAVAKYTGFEFSSPDSSSSQHTQSDNISDTTTSFVTTTETTTTAPITISAPSESTVVKTTSAEEKVSTTIKGEFDFTIIDILPLSLSSGSWDVRHCQGIAVDPQKGYIYYSYTNTFVKCDLEGNVVGTITGIEGHMGDVCFNSDDGKAYVSYNPQGKKALYIAIIDVDNLNQINLKAVQCGLIRTVHLKEVYKDFSSSVQVGEKTFIRKYGVSGTDGITFGPSFSTGRGSYLTVACGLTPQTYRSDNNYQILIQYNVKKWWDTYSQPLSFDTFHHNGPDKHNGKYFVYTGNTNYGVQTMVYFKEINAWILNVYPTTKETFKKYTMYIIDGDVKPKKEILKGQPTDTDEQYVLTLYQDGELDKRTGIYGWYTSFGNKGMAYISDGLFYIIHPFATWYNTQTAVAYLYVWDPTKDDPFTLAAGLGNDYTIPEKKKYVAPPTTAKATTTVAQTTKKSTEAFKVEDIFSIFG